MVASATADLDVLGPFLCSEKVRLGSSARNFLVIYMFAALTRNLNIIGEIGCSCTHRLGIPLPNLLGNPDVVLCVLCYKCSLPLIKWGDLYVIHDIFQL